MKKRKLMSVAEIRKIPDNLSHLYKIPVYDEKEDKPVKSNNPKRKNKYTLNQVGEKVDKLGERVDQISYTVDKLGERVDQISKRVDQLTITVDKLGKRVDQISYTVDKLGKRVDQLTVTVDKLGKRVDQIANRVDQLTTTVMVLAETVDKGFKQINARIDYIVKANSLKDIPSASAK